MACLRCSGHECVLQTSNSVLHPMQSKPPYFGEGLLHALYLFLKPPLHWAEHGPHSFHSPQPPSWGSGVDMGHGGFPAQKTSEWSGPTQTLPPCAGAGFVQDRLRVFTAMPQVAEQADHADHGVQPPCTVQLVTAMDSPEQGDPLF